MALKLYICLFITFYCILLSSGKDLNIGTTVNSVLAYVEDVKLSAIPLKTRTKNVFYNDEKNPKIIKGISAVDMDNSNAAAIVTAGGVGSNYVNVRIKSERGEGLNYHVQVFV